MNNNIKNLLDQALIEVIFTSVYERIDDKKAANTHKIGLDYILNEIAKSGIEKDNALKLVLSQLN